MTNENNKVLHIIGVANNIERISYKPKKSFDRNCFTHKYDCYKLVYAEVFSSVDEAIKREKQLKNWKREWKNELIDAANPQWADLMHL